MLFPGEKKTKKYDQRCDTNYGGEETKNQQTALHVSTHVDPICTARAYSNSRSAANDDDRDVSYRIISHLACLTS